GPTAPATIRRRTRRARRRRSRRIPWSAGLWPANGSEEAAMGWTYAFERPADPKAHLDARLTWSDGRGARRVLDSAIVRLRVYYAAVEHIAPDGDRQVWAAVFLVDF